MDNIIKIQAQYIEEHTIAIIDRLLGFPHEKKRFIRKHGYPLSLKNPTSLNEIICRKKTFDRSPELPDMADKIKSKVIISKKLNTTKRTIPTLWSGKDPETIPFNELPEDYVIKSNYGSGDNLIIRGDSRITEEEIKKTCSEWMKKPYGIRNHEWAYQIIDRNILIEPLITEHGSLPETEYKFLMAKGECIFILANTGTRHFTNRSVYTADWEYVPVSLGRSSAPHLPRPAYLKEMLSTASCLSDGRDLLRVDFYGLSDGFLVGELTHYPGDGRMQIEPTRYDFEFGAAYLKANGGRTPY